MARQRVRVVRTAHKLQAIKLVRELAGVGLKDAKDWVEGQQWFELELDAHARTQLDAHVDAYGSELDYEPLPSSTLPDGEPGLDPRLLDPRFEVRADLRYLEGPQKIAAIKLARELTGLGLKDTKDLVEQQGWVLRDVPIAEAKRAERRFAEFGSRVELVPRSLRIMAFDPRHPARGAQPLVRMRVTGSQLALERGRLDAWDASTIDSHGFDTPEQLEAAIAAQCRAWTDAHLEFERDEIRLLDRVSAREPRLEHDIRAAADPSEALLVYADWLAAQGDPRGELAPLLQVDARDEFEAALDRHALHLFGPLRDFVDHLTLEWRTGMVARVAMPPTLLHTHEPVFESFRKLLALPVMACVRSLCLRGSWLAHGDAIAACPSEVLSGVRELELASGSYDRLDIADWRALERLERLELAASHLRGGPLVLPRLRELCVSTRAVDHELIELFGAAALPELADFELCIRATPSASPWIEDYSETLRALLSTISQQVPLHGRFRLRVEEGLLDGRFVGLLFDAPLSRRVARLELAAILDADAVQTFERRRSELPKSVELSLGPPNQRPERG